MSPASPGAGTNLFSMPGFCCFAKNAVDNEIEGRSHGRSSLSTGGEPRKGHVSRLLQSGVFTAECDLDTWGSSRQDLYQGRHTGRHTKCRLCNGMACLQGHFRCATYSQLSRQTGTARPFRIDQPPVTAVRPTRRLPMVVKTKVGDLAIRPRSSPARHNQDLPSREHGRSRCADEDPACPRPGSPCRSGPH